MHDTTWKYGILKDLGVHNIGLKGHFPNFIKFYQNFSKQQKFQYTDGFYNFR